MIRMRWVSFVFRSVFLDRYYVQSEHEQFLLIFWLFIVKWVVIIICQIK